MMWTIMFNLLGIGLIVFVILIFYRMFLYSYRNKSGISRNL